MANRFSDGDRVTVSQDYHWAKNVRGRIGAPPAQVVGLSGPWKDNLTRTVQTRKGPVIFYWVWFDEPQRDAEGDGPYEGAEIPEKDILHAARRADWDAR